MVLRRNPRYWDAAHVKLAARAHARWSRATTPRSTCTRPASSTRSASASLPSEFMDHLRALRGLQRGRPRHVLLLAQHQGHAARRRARAQRAQPGHRSRVAGRSTSLRGGQIPSADMVPDGVAGYAGLHSPLFDPERRARCCARPATDPSQPLPHDHAALQHARRATSRSPRRCSDVEASTSASGRDREPGVEGLSQDLAGDDFQIARLGWVGDYPDPFTFLELLSDEQRQQPLELDATPSTTGCCAQANAHADRGQRLQLLQRAESAGDGRGAGDPALRLHALELMKPYLMGHFLNYQHRKLLQVLVDRRALVRGHARAAAEHAAAVPAARSRRAARSRWRHDRLRRCGACSGWSRRCS